MEAVSLRIFLIFSEEMLSANNKLIRLARGQCLLGEIP